MSLDDVYRARYYERGYVYIAGSTEETVLKIGGCKLERIYGEEKYLRGKKYGGLRDWDVIYYVAVHGWARIETAIHQELNDAKVRGRFYLRDGRRQRARELFTCSFRAALEATERVLASHDEAAAEAWQSPCASGYGVQPRRVRPPPLTEATNDKMRTADSSGYKSMDRDALLAMNINDITELPPVTARLLLDGGVNTVGRLTGMSKTQLKRELLMGWHRVEQIEKVIRSMGLQFRRGSPNEALEKVLSAKQNEKP